MRAYKARWPQVPARSQDCVLTLGNFDGLHRGHQALVRSVVEEAQATQRTSVVVLFEPQPREFFKPHEAPIRLTTLSEKLNALRALGVDEVWCLHFDAAWSQLTAAAFIEDFLIQILRCRSIHVGADVRFGFQRQGNLFMLQENANPHTFTVTVVPDVWCREARISSTRVRECLQEGRLQEAAELLGTEYCLSGRVRRGAGRGTKLGVPTANIYVPRAVPVRGVYAVRAEVNGVTYPAVANIGIRPSVEFTGQWLEVHCLKASEDFYDQRMHVHFCEFIRPEQRFESLEQLVTQIQQDISVAKRYFGLTK